MFEKGLVFITRRKSQKGESFYLHRCPPGKFFRRPYYSSASFNVILQTCFLVFFFHLRSGCHSCYVRGLLSVCVPFTKNL